MSVPGPSSSAQLADDVLYESNIFSLLFGDANENNNLTPNLSSDFYSLGQKLQFFDWNPASDSIFTFGRKWNTNLINDQREKMKREETSVFRRLGVGRRKPDDLFFRSGDSFCHMVLREGIVDFDDSEPFSNEIGTKKFPCNVPTCNLVLTSLSQFEEHFNSCHRFACSQCKKNLPSAHLLDLHLSESHSSFFAILAEKKPMYRCFVESCTVTSQTPKDRHEHCISFHNFPHDFRFDNLRKQNREKKKGKVGNKNKNGDSKNSEMEVDSTVRNPPPVKGSFSFGHSSAKGKLFIPRNIQVTKGQQAKAKSQKPDIKNDPPMNLTELMDTLPAE